MFPIDAVTHRSRMVSFLLDFTLPAFQQAAVANVSHYLAELLQHALSNEILLYSFISLGLLLGVTAARLIFRQIRKRRKKSTYCKYMD